MYTDQTWGPYIVFFNGSHTGIISWEKCRREGGLKQTNYRRLALRSKKEWGVTLETYLEPNMRLHEVYSVRNLYLTFILKDIAMNTIKLNLDVHPVCFL